MLRSAFRTLSLFLVLGVSACTAVVDGSVRPASGLAPRPLVGHSIEQVMLGDAELSRMFAQPLITDPNQPPRFGGREILSTATGTPPDCSGVPSSFAANNFTDSDVRDAASMVTTNATSYSAHPAVIMIVETVVSLPTAQAAGARFATLAQQWSHCNGVTVTWGDGYFSFDVSEVQEKDSVLTANVTQNGSATILGTRALGVRVNCIVQVEISFFGSRSRAPTAADVARLMMDKVSALS